ncbi:MAG: glutamate-5-semialdehyde dehydrogenase [Clostridia bacterium]|jgi:glutamate-5-semialdehyde dehydrogenase|nr:glutamate-5-semialdehyde dehydrogenase [Clostridiales bacterium]MDK2985203.1 glutamate-5-semialdehyde dehydrogenase [Clostridia bacterium]
MREVVEKAQKAQKAISSLAIATTDEKNTALLKIADVLEQRMAEILEYNEKDLERGREVGLSQALIDRLTLTEKRITAMAEGVREIVELEDPVGEVINRWKRPNGLIIEKVRVPLGVIGMIYEARPNVTVDSTALALKTGNAIVLRGGSSAINSNKAIVKIIHEALAETNIPVDAVQLIENTARSSAEEMLKMDKYLDVLIPRGGASLIRTVVENSTVPVLETGVGNCHVYVDKDADPDMAEKIVVNSKTNRPAVCNAAETLLVHEEWAKSYLSRLAESLQDAGVELRGCEEARKIVPTLKEASEGDWAEEYLDLIMAVRIVKSVEEAIKHIAKYGTKHTEAIVTDNNEIAQRFIKAVDAAAVNHNASTRFTDGFEYGFGAEIGISTQKLHARGPMGLPELTSYKYCVYGNGQVRG